MVAPIRVAGFGGQVPALDAHLLESGSATEAENTWVYSGALIGLPEPALLHSGASGTAKAYRIPLDYGRASYVFEGTWLEFSDRYTDVIRAPVFDDQYDRYYWASSSAPPMYNTRQRIVDGDPAWLLGIPAPTSTPGISATGGSGSDVSRAYVTTFVSAYGEEGPPSPPTTATHKDDDTWTITPAQPAADDMGVDRNITKIRIYRTVTTDTTVEYYLVAEIDTGTASYADSAADSSLTGNSTLESIEWTAPPTDLQGVVVLANGIVAGWRQNEVWFSYPYRPHAWPVSYVQTVEYPVVGLGVVNQQLVACTAGYPVIFTGSRPEYMVPIKVMGVEPCQSRGSIVSAPEGAYYASPNGLVLINAGGQAINITKDLIQQDGWASFTNLSALQAARLGTAWIAYGASQPGVFDGDAFDNDAFAMEDTTGSEMGLIIDPQNARVALNRLTTDEPFLSVTNDPWSGVVLLAKGGNIYGLIMSDAALERQPYRWRSKVFTLEYPANLGALQVFFDVPGSTPPHGSTRNNDLVQELQTDQYGLFRLWADGRHIATRELRKTGEVMRLPSGFKYSEVQFEVEARVRITSIHLAQSVRDLRAT